MKRNYNCLFAYGNDLLQGVRLPTQIWIRSEAVRALGWFAPPVLQHLFVDNAWLDLGEATDSIVQFPDLIVEHMHPYAGKGEWDQEYERVNSTEMGRKDQEAYMLWKASSFESDVAKLAKLVSEHSD